MAAINRNTLVTGGTREAQPSRSPVTQVTTHIEGFTSATADGIVQSPLSLTPQFDGGMRSGAKAEIPHIILCAPKWVDRDRMVGESSGDQPWLLYRGASAGGELSEGECNRMGTNAVGRGLACNASKLNPKTAGGPGQTGMAIVHRLLGRHEATANGTLPQGWSRNQLDSAAFEHTFRLMGVGAEETVEEVMNTQFSFSRGPVINDGTQQRISVKAVVLEQIAKRYLNLIYDMRTWKPMTNLSEIPMLVQSALVNGEYVPPGKYVQLAAPLGRKQIPQNQIAHFEIPVNGMFRQAAARQLAPHYTVLWQLMCVMNRFYEPADRLSTTDLMGQMMVMIAAYTDKIGHDAVFGNVDVESRIIDSNIDKIVGDAREFITKPWSKSWSDMDPGSVSDTLEFQEALLCFNFVLSYVVRNCGLPTLEASLIMPAVNRVERILTDMESNDKPDFMLGGSRNEIGYHLMSGMQAGMTVTDRRVTASTMGDFMYITNRTPAGTPRTRRVPASDQRYFQRRYGMRDARKIPDLETITIEDGSHAPLSEKKFRYVSYVVQRNASISVRTTEQSEYEVIHTQRAAGAPSTDALSGSGLLSNPTDLNMYKNLTWRMTNARGFFEAYYVNANVQPHACYEISGIRGMSVEAQENINTLRDGMYLTTPQMRDSYRSNVTAERELNLKDDTFIAPESTSSVDVSDPTEPASDVVPVVEATNFRGPKVSELNEKVVRVSENAGIRPVGEAVDGSTVD